MVSRSLRAVVHIHIALCAEFSISSIKISTDHLPCVVFQGDDLHWGFEEELIFALIPGLLVWSEVPSTRNTAESVRSHQSMEVILRASPHMNACC